MRYDPEDRELYFSTQMVPDEKDTKACYDHYEEYLQWARNHPGAWVRKEMKADGIKAVAGMILVIAILVGIIAAVLCLPIKKYEYIPWIIGAIMLLIGIGFFFPYPDDPTVFVSADKAFHRIEGAILIIGAIGLIIVNYICPRDNMTIFLLTCICEILFVIAIAMVVKAIGYKTAPKYVYTEEIDAGCIGYVRSYDAQPDATYVHNRTTDVPVYSPLFEYYYNGEKIQAYYDILLNGTKGKIKVGSNTKIRINPDRPSSIWGYNPTYFVMPSCTAFFCLAGSVVLFILLMR